MKLNQYFKRIFWCPHTDSNRGPTDFKSTNNTNDIIKKMTQHNTIYALHPRTLFGPEFPGSIAGFPNTKKKENLKKSELAMATGSAHRDRT